VGALALEPAEDFYVNDDAGMLSAETKAEIIRYSTELAAATGARIAVVAVMTLDGQTPHDFAYELGNSWGMGNNSLLLLLAPTEGTVWVEVGFGLAGTLNDSVVDGYINTYAMGAYNNRDYDGGTLELYKALYSHVMVENGLEALPGYEPAAQKYQVSTALLTGIVVVAVIILGLSGRMRRRNQRKTPPSGGYSSNYQSSAYPNRGGGLQNNRPSDRGRPGGAGR